MFYYFSKSTVIDLVLEIATYTYGPLLGLFALGIFTQAKPRGWGVFIISLLVPSLCFVFVKFLMPMINDYFVERQIFPENYQIGFELLLFNGLFSFVGYWLLGKFQQDK